MKILRLSCIVLALFIGSAAASALAKPSVDLEAQARETWRETMTLTQVPAEGCFHASYPSKKWNKVECTVAPRIPLVPRRGIPSETVGDGTDYVAQINPAGGLITKSIGFFPKVQGVTSEIDNLYGANAYSIQLNSNLISNATACGNYSECYSWQQFAYVSDYEQAFIQYWLIRYGYINQIPACPEGWTTYFPNCYMNSPAVTVGTAPISPVSELPYLKMSGSAVLGGNDTLTFTTETDAYSVTGEDSIADLATGWNQSEFNIFGDGEGSKASFNTGSLLHVRVKVIGTTPTTDAPTCVSGAGTTGETNNLNLLKCVGSPGTIPSILFGEKN